MVDYSRKLIVPRSSVICGRMPFFTLIGLMVVIAIIAILEGLLLPALNQVWEKARSISCCSYLATIGKAMLMCVQDNRDWYPCFSNKNGGWVSGGKDIVECGSGNLRYTYIPSLKGIYLGRISSTWKRETFSCPSNPGIPNAHYFTLDINGHSFKDRAISTAISSKTAQPSLSAYYLDRDNTTMTDNTSVVGFFSIWPNPGYLHSGGVNIVFCDGHAEWRLKNQIPPLNTYANWTVPQQPFWYHNC